jgi:GT2 family glycosyltransferase
MPPQVSIIILCHNDKRYLRECAASVERHTEPGLCEYIFIDNGSNDSAFREMARIKRGSIFPARIIRNRTNLFFGPANNQGLAAAKGEFVVFLNADTLAAPGWLSIMLSALRSNPHLGMVGPMTNSAVGLQVVNRFCENDLGRANWFAKWKKTRPAGIKIVPWIIGFCVLMPRKLAAKLGGFDERYGPGGFEDYDLCLKTRLAGYEIGIATGAYVHHLGGKGYGGMDYDQMRKCNRELYKSKWCGLMHHVLKQKHETSVFSG